MKPDVPQVLINREPLHHFNFDVELLGNCDAIINEVCRRLGGDWNDVIADYTMPPLDKEAVEKMFEEGLSSDLEESDESCAEGSDDATALQGDGVMNEGQESKGGLNIDSGVTNRGSGIDSEDNEELIRNKEFEKSDEEQNDTRVEDSVPIHLDQIMCVDTETIKCESKTEKDTIICCKNRGLGDERKENIIYENGRIIEEKTELILSNKSRKFESNMQVGTKRTIEGTDNESCKNCQKLLDSEREKKMQKPNEDDAGGKVTDDIVDSIRKQECKCDCGERKRKKTNSGGSCSTDLKNDNEGDCHTINSSGDLEKTEKPPLGEGQSLKSEDAEKDDKVEAESKLKDEIRESSPLFDKEAIMQKFGDEGWYCIFMQHRLIPV